MLLRTFRHIRGIGPKREAELWKRGILTWEAYEDQFDRQLSLFGLAEGTFGESRKKLEARDSDFFASLLPSSEHFRLAMTFPKDTLFIDIETSGTGFSREDLTVVGWSMGNQFQFYFQGESPASLVQAVQKAKAVVTFNGTSFDIPFLQRAFPELHFPPCHIDLRFLARQVGLSGGQKNLEKQLGLYRPEEILEITGKAAPWLWRQYLKGDLNSLLTLVHYNYADVYGMKWILDDLISRIIDQRKLPVTDFYTFGGDKGNIQQYLNKLEEQLREKLKMIM